MLPAAPPTRHARAARAYERRDETEPTTRFDGGPWLRFIAPPVTLVLTLLVSWGVSDAPLTAAHYAAFPVSMLLSILIEYGFHRFLLHHRRGRLLREAHHQHHLAFVPGAMTLRSYRELTCVLFPAWATLGFMAATSPIVVAAALLWDLNAGLMWLVTVGVTVTSYEQLHLCSHLPGSERGPLGYWVRHHRRHHEPQRMTREDFSVLLPALDAIAGTHDESTV